MKAAIWLLLFSASICAAEFGEMDEAEKLVGLNDSRLLRLRYSRQLEGEWHQFKLRYGKFYSSHLEETFRRQVWESNHHRVQRHNLLAKLGARSFTLGMNRFADLTSREFVAEFVASAVPTKKLPIPLDRRSATIKHGPSPLWRNPDPPARVDWRLKQCVSPVSDQGQLGSSAVFGVVGAIEGQLCARFGHQRTWLSKQQVIDCAESLESPDAIYDYLASNQGRLDEGIPSGCYIDTGKKGPCAFNPNCTAATVQAVAELPAGDEAALQSAVAFAGPATVVVDASHPSFQLYSSGVYNEPDCSSQDLDHVMLAAGYGVATSGEPFWLVRNSWGANWGESGYILMSRNHGNQCGIASMASFPFVRPPY